MSNKGKIFLIPTSIAEDTAEKVIPLQIREALVNIKHFLVEDVRTARRYLSSLKLYSSIEELSFNILDKDTKRDVLKEFFKPVDDGFNLGIISESGCPGVADPGALAVNYAHEQELQVIPLVGPSSILLSLMMCFDYCTRMALSMITFCSFKITDLTIKKNSNVVD